jgi:hypothetical protein
MFFLCASHVRHRAAERSPHAGDQARPEVILYEWQLARGRSRGIANSLWSAISPGHKVRVFALSVSDKLGGFREHDAIDAYFTKPVNMAMLDQFLAESRDSPDEIQARHEK